MIYCSLGCNSHKINFCSELNNQFISKYTTYKTVEHNNCDRLLNDYRKLVIVSAIVVCLGYRLPTSAGVYMYIGQTAE